MGPYVCNRNNWTILQSCDYAWMRNAYVNTTNCFWIIFVSNFYSLLRCTWIILFSILIRKGTIETLANKHYRFIRALWRKMYSCWCHRLCHMIRIITCSMLKLTMNVLRFVGRRETRTLGFGQQKMYNIHSELPSFLHKFLLQSTPHARQMITRKTSKKIDATYVWLCTALSNMVI